MGIYAQQLGSLLRDSVVPFLGPQSLVPGLSEVRERMAVGQRHCLVWALWLSQSGTYLLFAKGKIEAQHLTQGHRAMQQNLDQYSAYCSHPGSLQHFSQAEFCSILGSSTLGPDHQCSQPALPRHGPLGMWSSSSPDPISAHSMLLEASFCRLHHLGPLALWFPGRIGKWEAHLGNQKAERVWRGLGEKVRVLMPFPGHSVNPVTLLSPLTSSG